MFELENFKCLLPHYSKIDPVSFSRKFTVFTPVYNAEKTIERVYKALISQSFKDFEWLIINDGSTDDTHRVIASILEHSVLDIHYINNKTNQHKMGCFIQAIQEAKGELFLTLDADDECTTDALDILNEAYLSIPEHKKSSVIAVTGLCKDQNGDRVGSKYPEEVFYSDAFKLFAVDKVNGEKWGFTKTTALRGISFEKILEGHYLPEGLVWCLLAKQGYQTIYINKIIRIYHTDVTGSISSVSADKTAIGAVALHIAYFNWFFKSYGLKAPIFFLKNLYLLIRNSKYLDYDLKTYTSSIDSRSIRLAFTILYPFRSFFS